MQDHAYIQQFEMHESWAQVQTQANEQESTKRQRGTPSEKVSPEGKCARVDLGQESQEVRKVLEYDFYELQDAQNPHPQPLPTPVRAEAAKVTVGDVPEGTVSGSDSQLAGQPPQLQLGDEPKKVEAPKTVPVPETHAVQQVAPTPMVSSQEALLREALAKIAQLEAQVKQQADTQAASRGAAQTPES